MGVAAAYKGAAVLRAHFAKITKDRMVIGIVLNPINGELFTATCDLAAEINRTPISVSVSSKIAESLLVTEFPYNVTRDI